LTIVYYYSLFVVISENRSQNYKNPLKYIQFFCFFVTLLMFLYEYASAILQDDIIKTPRSIERGDPTFTDAVRGANR
jgi:hypothetical protein